MPQKISSRPIWSSFICEYRRQQKANKHTGPVPVEEMAGGQGTGVQRRQELLLRDLAVLTMPLRDGELSRKYEIGGGGADLCQKHPPIQ